MSITSADRGGSFCSCVSVGSSWPTASQVQRIGEVKWPARLQFSTLFGRKSEEGCRSPRSHAKHIHDVSHRNEKQQDSISSLTSYSHFSLTFMQLFSIDRSIHLHVMPDEKELLQFGICRIPIPSEDDWLDWASQLSQPTLDNWTFEGDNQYAFYRNIMDDEPDFPFATIFQNVTEAMQRYFGVNSMDDLRLDDAFCVHYNTSQKDSSGAKHTDPSDITVNLCLERSEDVKGSQVKFYGTKALNGVASEETRPVILVEQRPGYATIHWGDHPHETLPIECGRRTNIILTFLFKDKSRSQAANRTCYYF